MSDLKNLLSNLDDHPGPLCEDDISNAIKGLEEQSEQIQAELIAFEFTESLDDTDYFGPPIFKISTNGQKIGFPDKTHVTPEILEYWSQRARSCKHPVLKARYSGLVWEFSGVVTGRPADVCMARLRIESVTTIAANNCHNVPDVVIIMLGHALQLAIRINDKGCTESVRDSIIAYEDRIAGGDEDGPWGFSYNLLWKKKKVSLTEEQKLKIIRDLEERLERLSNPSGGLLPVPGAPEGAAIRLAEHYRTLNAKEDIRRVLLKYGRAFEPLCLSASPFQVFVWLQEVHKIYSRFDLKQEAAQIRQRLHSLGLDVVRGFGSIAVPMTIERDEMESHIKYIFEGDDQDTAQKIIREFLPLRRDMEQDVRQSVKHAPLIASISPVLTDSEGRPLAQIGSVEEDLEGRILYQLNQSMSLSAPILRLILSAWSERFGWGSEALVEYLRSSPLFEEDRMPFIREGANAYVQGDALIATHLWIPQVEQAIRRLAVLRGDDVQKPNRVEGLNWKTLDELLRDATPKVLEVLGPDIALYFRALFTDPRGWNLRNNICHGLLPAEQVQLEAADRVLHSLLILGKVRKSLSKVEVDAVEVKESGVPSSGPADRG